MHFVSCSDCGPKGHPVGLGEQRPLQFGLDEARQAATRKAVGEPVAAGAALAERLEFAERLARAAFAAACGFCMRSRKLAVAIWDAGAQQDALAAALRRGRPPVAKGGMVIG